MCMFCKSLFVFLYFFLLALVLSVFLQFTDSDNPFGIVKLFLTIYMSMYVIRRVSYKKNSLLTLRKHPSSPAVFVGSMLLIFLFFSVILCFVCLHYVSCVPNVASVGGLIISDFLSVFYVCLTLSPSNDSACTNLRK
jgi:hypothetical protein